MTFTGFNLKKEKYSSLYVDMLEMEVPSSNSSKEEIFEANLDGKFKIRFIPVTSEVNQNKKGWSEWFESKYNKEYKDLVETW